MAFLPLLLVLGFYSSLCLGTPFYGPPDALTSCLAAASVPYAAKNSSQWIQDTKPYNLRLAYIPEAVAIPITIKHIQDAVKCGRQHGVRVSAKSGGHSYGSFGFGGEDGHLVVVMDAMDKVTLNKDMSCTIQAGARLGHVATELFNTLRRALSHGTCPGVGITGHALHGGYGMSSRTYGLTLDRLVGATVVMADGSIKYSSEWDTPNFHWALKGAGSSFGIVAELDFMTFAASEVLTSFSIDLDWSEEEAVEGILAFQEFGVNAPRELNMQIFMGPRGQTIQGLYHGGMEGLNTALRPLLGEINAQVSKTKTMNWIESVEHFADGQPLVQRRPYDRHSTFYTTSLLTHALTRHQVESLVNALFTNAKDPSARKSWYLLLDLFGGTNSAISENSPSSTAFPHRDKLLLYQFSDSGPNGSYPPEGFDLLRRFRESVTSSMADGEWGMYANYLDTQLDGDTAARLYYGGNLERLRELKREFDPDDVFWNPQGIRPA
ncbi:FAD-binding PCMH-type domain-containing protein [Fusarium sp. Ph1]|nr:FAD-binding PCMH-type domain-containing protein [Fusarium sp. Ph1]